MMEAAALADVVKYWDAHPVHSVEFDQGADLKAYCEAIDRMRWSDNERWARRFYDFPLPEGARVLDAGCGIGVCARYYARKRYRVYAVDISPRAVDITRRSFELLGLEGEVQVGNVEQLPYPDQFFDAVVSNGVIHHTPQTEQAVGEFYRVLKPAGFASCCIYYRNVLLRPPGWEITKRVLPLALKKRSGREAILSVETPEELVRSYDGNGTPIAKLYSADEARELFHRFEITAMAPHYFPARFLRGVRPGGLVHRLLDAWCGTLMYVLVAKPAV